MTIEKTKTPAVAEPFTDTLNRSHKVPLYHQLYLILRQKIMSGEWSQGDLLPAESELEKQYQVSRITVRKALEALVNDNLIVRQRGRGTFVSHPTMTVGAKSKFSFAEEMRRRKLEPDTHILDLSCWLASDLTAKSLQIEVGEELARIQRLCLVNGEPQCIEDAVLVHRYCPGILEKFDRTRSLSEVLEQYGIGIIRAFQTVSAIIPSLEIARWLQLSSDQPVLFVEQISYSQANIPVEYRRIYYRADRYVFQHEIYREDEPP